MTPDTAIKRLPLCDDGWQPDAPAGDETIAARQGLVMTNLSRYEQNGFDVTAWIVVGGITQTQGQ